MLARLCARRLYSSSSSLPSTIRQLIAAPKFTGNSPIEVQGWVQSIRKQKKVAFAVISDGSSHSGLQAVFTDVNLAKQCVAWHRRKPAV